MAGCLAVAAVAFGEAGEWISAGAAAVAELHEFSRALLPCLTAAAAAGGMVTGAAARYAATGLFMDILISLTRTLLLPLAYALLAVRTAGAALGNEALNSAAKLIKWLCFGLTAGLMTVFTLYLNLSGAVTGAADAAAARAANVEPRISHVERGALEARSYFPFRDCTYLLDVRKAARFGLPCPQTALEEGMERAYAWYRRERPQLADPKMSRVEEALRLASREMPRFRGGELFRCAKIEAVPSAQGRVTVSW